MRLTAGVGPDPLGVALPVTVPMGRRCLFECGLADATDAVRLNAVQLTQKAEVHCQLRRVESPSSAISRRFMTVTTVVALKCIENYTRVKGCRRTHLRPGMRLQVQSGWVTKCPARDGLARLTLIKVRLGHAEGEARDRVEPEEFFARRSTPAEKELLEEAGVPNADTRVLHIV